MSCAHRPDGACGPCYKAVLRKLEVYARDLSAARSDLRLVCILRDAARNETEAAKARRDDWEKAYEREKLHADLLRAELGTYHDRDAVRERHGVLAP